MSKSMVRKVLHPEDVRIGATLRQLREDRGVKVGELANAMDISYAYLSNIEAGRKRLTPPLLVRACKALDVRQAAVIRSDHFADEVA